MNKCILGKSGYEVSRIGLGTVQFGLDYGFTKKKTQNEVDEILSFADTCGVTLLDTARSYGDSEEKIGNYISQNKNKFIIATKLGKIKAEDSLKYESLKSKVYKSITDSLQYLKSNRLNILQLHQTDAYLINNESFWSVLRKAKEERLVDSIGVSVYETEEGKYLIDNYKREIDFLQIPYNIFDRRFESLRNIFYKNNVGIISRSTFLKGIITCSRDILPPELEGLKPVKGRLERFAAAEAMSLSDIALLYVCAKDFISSTIIGIDNVEELKANIGVLEANIDMKRFAELDDIKVEERNLVDPRKWNSF